MIEEEKNVEKKEENDNENQITNEIQEEKKGDQMEIKEGHIIKRFIVENHSLDDCLIKFDIKKSSHEQFSDIFFPECTIERKIRLKSTVQIFCLSKILPDFPWVDFDYSYEYINLDKKKKKVNPFFY